MFFSELFQKAADRGGYGVEKYEQLEFQQKVSQHYQILRDDTWQVSQYIWSKHIKKALGYNIF